SPADRRGRARAAAAACSSEALLAHDAAALDHGQAAVGRTAGQLLDPSRGPEDLERGVALLAAQPEREPERRARLVAERALGLGQQAVLRAGPADNPPR